MATPYVQPVQSKAPTVLKQIKIDKNNQLALDKETKSAKKNANKTKSNETQVNETPDNNIVSNDDYVDGDISITALLSKVISLSLEVSAELRDISMKNMQLMGNDMLHKTFESLDTKIDGIDKKYDAQTTQAWTGMVMGGASGVIGAFGLKWERLGNVASSLSGALTSGGKGAADLKTMDQQISGEIKMLKGDTQASMGQYFGKSYDKYIQMSQQYSNTYSQVMQSSWQIYQKLSEIFNRPFN